MDKHDQPIPFTEHPTVCNICGALVEFVDNRVIYGRPYGKWPFAYLCSNPKCRAYTGCHPNTERALGTLADKRLRVMRGKAHAAFDPLHKEKRFPSRAAAYNWLAGQLAIDWRECHIGMFDEEMCQRVIDVSRAKYDEKAEGYTVRRCDRAGECPKGRPWAVFTVNRREKVSGCYSSVQKAWFKVQQLEKEAKNRG